MNSNLRDLVASHKKDNSRQEKGKVGLQKGRAQGVFLWSQKAPSCDFRHFLQPLPRSAAERMNSWMFPPIFHKKRAMP